MSYTVRVVCEATEFDDRVTLSEDALVRDLLIEAGVTETIDLLNCSPLYYQQTQPVPASILLSITRTPDGETLFVHE